MISLKHVSKSFGPLKAVDDASLEVKKGEIICLIKAMRSQPDASVTVLEPTLKIEIPFRSISARKAFTSSLS